MRLTDEPLVTRGAIAKRVRELAKEISADYDGRELLVVPVLKGGLFFAADLLRALSVPVTVEFIRARSYAGIRSKGTVEFEFLPERSLAGKAVLIVEDILDTGRTTAAIFDRLERQEPESLAVCALLDKQARRVLDIEARYVGFTIDNHFVVGYGLDYEERYRELPDVRVLEEG